MKILMIGDRHDTHGSLARALRARGHAVDLIWDEAEIASRRNGPFARIRFLYDVTQWLPELAGYDVVQLFGPRYLPFAYGKIKYIFGELKKRNRYMGLTVSEPGYMYASAAVKSGLFRFSMYRTGSDKSALARMAPHAEYELLSNDLRDYTHWLLAETEGVMALAPEYAIPLRESVGKSLFGVPWPVEPAHSLPWRDGRIYMRLSGNHNDDVAYGRTSLRLAAEKIAAASGGRCVMEERGDAGSPSVLLDSMTSYSPGIEALQAMASGTIAVSGAQPEYYECIGAGENERPVICGVPDGEQAVARELAGLIADADAFASRSEQSRHFIEKYHSPAIAARRFENYWKEKIG